MRITLRIQERAGAEREMTLESAVDVGRDVETPDIRIEDPAISRRHARLQPTDHGVQVTDLGSSNGTTVSGGPVPPGVPVLAADGAMIAMGDTTIHVSCRETDPARSDQTTPATAPLQSPATLEPAPPESAPDRPPVARPRVALDDLEVLENDAIVIRSMPGTLGSKAAAKVAAAAAQARRKLAGLGSEPWGAKPTICLVDPYPAPDNPATVVTEGTTVDAAHDEIWMVVTAEAPAEHPARPLTLLFGSHLPAAEELSAVLEGFGMVVGGAPDPAEQLRELPLPPLEAADGELRTAMATSFVHHLVGREGDDGVRKLLGTSRPGTVDSAAREVYGLSMVELEEGWRTKLQQREAGVPTRQFLKMSLHYLRPHARRQAEIFVYMLLGLAFTMAFPFVSKRLFDTAIPSGNFSEVFALLLVLGGALAVSLLAGLRRAYLSAYVSSSIVVEVRRRMFDKLQVLDAAWMQRHHQGDVLSRMFSDVGAVQRGLSETLSEGLFQFLSLIVAAAIMLKLDPMLGVIVLVGAPTVAGVYRLMGAGAQKRSLAVQEQSSQLLSLTGENYAASPVVRMFGLAGRERDRFERASQRLFRSQLRLNLYGGLFGLSVNMIVTILRLFVLGLGAWLILEGRFTIGGLVAFLGIMGEVISPVTVLTNIGQDLQAATGALQRVNEVLDAEPEVRDADDAVEAQPVSREIRFSSVSFSYDGTHQTLTDLDFTIPAGARVAFVGPSGSGKSTVLRLLMRLYDPAEGALLVDGVDLRKLTTASYRDQMGVVFQDNFLFTTTLGENIALGRRGASENEVHDAARAAEVDTFIERLPRGYDTLVGERGGLLSGGQRQRVAVARALIRKPSVLLLDEATSALDPRTERQINDTLQRVAHGLTTVAVTHRLTAIVDYDRIFVLVEGRLVEQGSHADLIAEGGVYAHLWAEQTGEAVPAGPDAFDSISVLAQLPPFAGLDKAALADVAGRLSAGSMEPGSVMTEGEGQLVLVVSGRAQVWQPGLGGPAVSAEFGAGDVFGLSALLGNTRDAELRAVDQCRIAVLDAATIRTLAERYPSVAAGLARGGSRVAPAAGGRQLTRATFAGLPQMTPDRPEGQLPSVDHRRIQQEVRRASGAYDRILP